MNVYGVVCSGSLLLRVFTCLRACMYVVGCLDLDREELNMALVMNILFYFFYFFLL